MTKKNSPKGVLPMTKQKKLRHSEYYDLQPVFDKLYADSPVGDIQTKKPIFKKKKVCSYTPEGRAEIHKSLGINTAVMLALMRMKETRRSVEYMDNRIFLYAAQYGR